jgi:hypothetical protein
MSLAVAILIVVAATGIAIMAMLWVRRRAPDGSYFNDGDRAAGVFGVLATGFAVLLGFVVFLAFTSYDTARAGAESEARIVAQQVETAQLLPPAVSAELTAELVCYAHSVAGVQWDRMEGGHSAKTSTRGEYSCLTRSSAPIPRLRQNRRRTASGSTSDQRAKKRAATASTVRSA